MSAGTGLSESLAKLELELRLAIALAQSGALRARVLAGRNVLLLVLPLRAGWVRVSSQQLSISRELPSDSSGVEPTSYLDLLDGAALSAETDDTGALAAANETARNLVVSLFQEDRLNFSRLMEWAPVIESSAHTVASRVVETLDEMRRTVHEACVNDRPEADQLASSYRRLVDALGRATFLSSNFGSHWLSEAAASFDWTSWTPSLPLMRERDLRSAAIAARTASRLGPHVLDKYLAGLRTAQDPLIAVDALVGITAIGLRYPAERAALIGSLDADLEHLSDRSVLAPELVARGYSEARRQLTDGVSDMNASFSPRADALALDPKGRMLIFRHLATAIDGPVSKFVGSSSSASSATPGGARKIFLRAWRKDHPDLSLYPDSAFVRA